MQSLFFPVARTKEKNPRPPKKKIWFFFYGWGVGKRRKRTQRPAPDDRTARSPPATTKNNPKIILPATETRPQRPAFGANGTSKSTLFDYFFLMGVLGLPTCHTDMLCRPWDIGAVALCGHSSTPLWPRLYAVGS